MALKYYIQDLLGILDKDEVVSKSDMQSNIVAYEQEAKTYQKMFRVLHALVKDPKLINHQRNEIKKLEKAIGVNYRDNAEFIGALLDGIGVLVNASSILGEYTEKNFGNYVVRDALTVKQLAILEAGKTYTSSIDIFIGMFEYISVLLSDSKPIYKKRPEEFLDVVRKDKLILKMILDRKYIKSLLEIDKLPDSIASETNGKIAVPKNNFTGKLVFAFTSWWYLRSAAEIDRKKATLELLRLRLNELEDIVKRGGSTVAIQKQIEYYENTIAELEKEIEEFYRD
jgi:hypothetical protein